MNRLGNLIPPVGHVSYRGRAAADQRIYCSDEEVSVRGIKALARLVEDQQARLFD